jgi:anthranilate 1,2-dioxygenase small subunit
MADDRIRQRIEDFIHDYAHCIDDDRLEEWPEFFTDPCRYQIIDRENHARGSVVGVMTCDSRGMLRDRILALRDANIYEPHVYRHLISGIRIRGETDGAWSVQSSYAVIRTMQNGDVSVFSSGKYLDKIILEQDQLRFLERIVICDSIRIDILLVIPI